MKISPPILQICPEHFINWFVMFISWNMVDNLFTISETNRNGWGFLLRCETFSKVCIIISFPTTWSYTDRLCYHHNSQLFKLHPYQVGVQSQKMLTPEQVLSPILLLGVQKINIIIFSSAQLTI